MSIRSLFENVFEKISFVFYGALALLAALLFRKIVHDKRKRIDSDSGTDRPTAEHSQRAEELNKRADELSKDAGDAAQSILDVIERVKDRE